MTKPTPSRPTAGQRPPIVLLLALALAAVALVVVPIVVLEQRDARGDRETQQEVEQLDDALCYPGEPGC
ncbi:hypothetical protein [Jiangella muralis]|uniref:hypothetical protein n=1 Tax=Jiangella muralis TaxID=702383 RepID=UPI0012F7A25E|nr:hypothetical protein [Jiangella muralis]